VRSEQLKQNIERFPGRLPFFLSLIVIRLIPETLHPHLSFLIGNLVFLLTRKKRQMAVENLTSAFKNEKTPQEIKRMARLAFCEIAHGAIESAHVLSRKTLTEERIMKIARVEGSEYLDAALKRKKGVICVSAHFGNFMIMAKRLSQMGYSCSTVIKDSAKPAVAGLWQNIRREVGMNWISARPRNKAVSESLRWLKKGGVLILYADQNKSDGVYVDFFDRPAGTVEGPALLHLRTGAEIVCAFIVRQGTTRHRVIITPPVQVEKTGNREKDLYQVTQAFTKRIEDFVRRYPEQWWWPHKRWKKDR
jgi:Kdo2-lipid IVA lauroyltransferase/acyltransferase